MKDPVNFSLLCDESKHLVGMTPQDETVLHALAAIVIPALDGITDRFYSTLNSVPRTAAFIEGRVEVLKKTHRSWMESLFTREFDPAYTEWMYQIGLIHVKVDLPVEFMTSGMSLVLRELLLLVVSNATLNIETRTQGCVAISAACNYCQLIMQKSYDTGKLADELEKFLQITGMSRKLFENLAAAYTNR
jgi:hypothetical protein